MRAFPFLVYAIGAIAASTNGVACDKPKFRVVIDVGHSPAAPGAISARGVTEYSFNLRLTTMIASSLIARGYVDTFTIATGGGVANLSRRTARANTLGADLFLSVHHDSAQPQYFERWTFNGREHRYCDRFKGWSIFVSNANPAPQESLRFAQALARRLLARGLPFSTHHAERIPGESRTFLDAAHGVYRYDGLAVLRGARAPAALLEAGVIVNREEESALSTTGRQSEIAEAVAEGVDAYCSGR